ncbi:MAG TPA: flagellar hook-basal body complex protein FliE [Candidatus Binatia bacterium]|nr:flagellar hook-basal body complex protein FliE [Candidatus Binatia bacterium]
MDVTRIGGGLPELAPARPEGAAAGGGARSFGQVLEDSLAQVQSLQQEADTAIQSLATGGQATLHDTMLAVQKADLSFRLMMQVRNKIVEAYQEVLRMQV